MPHIIVEYSANLSADLDLNDLMKELHINLGDRESVDIKRIKTRAIPLDHFVVGVPDNTQPMIHITIKLMPGRGDDLKKQMAKGLYDIAKTYAKDAVITVEITELHAESYTA